MQRNRGLARMQTPFAKLIRRGLTDRVRDFSFARHRKHETSMLSEDALVPRVYRDYVRRVITATLNGTSNGELPQSGISFRGWDTFPPYEYEELIER